jgi:hypothetical protein
MSRSSCSPGSAASDDDPDSMTDYSSAEQSGGEEDKEEKHVHPPEYYSARAEEIDSADVVPAHSDGTTRLVDKLDELWTQ